MSQPEPDASRQAMGRPGDRGGDGHRAEALRLLGMGIAALPVNPNGAKPKKPALRTWGQYAAELPTAKQVKTWFRPALGRDLGILIPAGCCCLDVDAAGDRHKGVDASAQREALQAIIPAVGHLPGERTPSGGQHLFGRLPEGMDPSDLLTCLEAEGLELRTQGIFVKTTPSAGYLATEPLPHPEEWPEMPAEVLALFRREKRVGPHAAPGEGRAGGPQGEEQHQPVPGPSDADQERAAAQLEAYRQAIPGGLQDAGGGRYTARCPLHDDQTPSFEVRWSEERQEYRWTCYAKCEGSATVFRPDLNGGRLEDLLALLRRREAAGRRATPEPYAEAAATLEAYLPPDGAERTLALALVGEYQACGLDPYGGPVGIGYRRIARRSGLDWDPATGTLANTGRTIKTAAVGLVRRGLGWHVPRGANGGNATSRWHLAPLLRSAARWREEAGDSSTTT